MSGNNLVAAMAEILSAVEDSVRVAGDQGAPGGIIYAALMAHGCSLSQFQAIMRALVIAKRVSQQGDLYFIVPLNTEEL